MPHTSHTPHTSHSCWLAAAALAMLMLVPRAAADEHLQGYSGRFAAMGSTVELSLYASDQATATRAFETVQEEMERLNAIFSDYDRGSETMRLLDAATDGQLHAVSPPLWELLRVCDDLHRSSGGSFNAAIGRLTRLWRTARRQNKLPTAEEIAEAREHCNWNAIEFVPPNLVRIRDPQLRLDFGGVAGGYIVDAAFDRLTGLGIDRCLINFGGDIRCGTAPPDRSGWRIEVAGLGEDAPPLESLTLTHAAMTTSGDLYQFVEIDGVRRSHILDARTGYGIPGPASVTVIGKTCLDVDAAATTLSVLGIERGRGWLHKNYPTARAIFISVGEGEVQIDRVTAAVGDERDILPADHTPSHVEIAP